MGSVGLRLVDGNDVAETPEFDDFWLMYPRRVAKKDAMKAWARMTIPDRVDALTALVDWRRVWRTKETDFIPYPATWLNGERWQDELPTVAASSHASHVSAAIPESRERTAMPDKVKALLAKLRGDK